MKRVKLLSFIFIFLFIFITGNVVLADTEKPESYITIKGIEGDYVACYAAKDLTGVNYDYEQWLKYYKDSLDYNPIMKYKDDEGYRWITTYFKCSGEAEIELPRDCPSEYKIIIYKNNRLYAATKPIEQYAYSSYYEIDFSLFDLKGSPYIIVKETYDYKGEITNMLLRIGFSIIIEMFLLFLFRIRGKRNILFVLITNIITQSSLNLLTNIYIYKYGYWTGGGMFILAGFGVFIIEFILYKIFLRTRRGRKIFYPMIASFLSFLAGIYIYLMM